MVLRQMVYLVIHPYQMKHLVYMFKWRTLNRIKYTKEKLIII